MFCPAQCCSRESDDAFTCVRHGWPQRGGMSTRPTLPRNVWILGFVSLCMDLSREIYHALLPAFITLVLGLPATALGAIDGLAGATANLAKLFSGRLSDRSLKRNRWVVAGYGLAALSKPLFPLASNAPHLLLARFAD